MKIKGFLAALGMVSVFGSAMAWPTVDLSDETSRQVVVAAGTEKVYNGHPTTAMLEDGKTIFCVWPTGHGGYAGNAAVSTDAGFTWTRVDDRLPEGAKLNVECPLIHRLVGPDGKSRLWVWSGFRARSLSESMAPVGTEGRKAAARVGDPMPALLSEDDGKTWKEMPPLGAKFRCVLSFQAMIRLKDGSYLGIYHRGPEACIDQPPLELMGAVTRDGGFTWSDPVVVAKVAGLDLCEPWAFRSPDGREICVLIRENHWLAPSKVIFSRDEGKTWTAPRDVPPGLSGHRHQGVVLPDGRIVVCMRDTEKGSPTVCHFVAWVGSYESIRTGKASPGDYRVKLLHSYAGADCGYPGVHLLQDGTVVATTYVKYRPDKNRQSIVSVRFKVSETDHKAGLARKTVLLLGDSIRLGYCWHVREMLKGTADVYFPENENGMFAYYTLRRIWDWTKLVPDPKKVDVIHFNNGLWDLGQRDGRECLTPVDVYAATMSRIADELRHFFPHAKLVFATTTPINERVLNEQHLKGNAEVSRYNAAALKALDAKIDAVDDLNRFVRENGLAAHQVDIVHYDEAGYRLLAGEVVRAVNSLLK